MTNTHIAIVNLADPNLSITDIVPRDKRSEYTSNIFVPIDINNEFTILTQNKSFYDCVRIDGVLKIQLNISKYDVFVVETNEARWREMREMRNNLLADSDFTQLIDAQVTNIESWRTYRQALRDLPEIITDINNITWPAKPIDI